MNNSLPVASECRHGPGHQAAVPHAAINLLLVSQNDGWVDAVQSATTKIGRARVSRCDAKGAVTRLATTAAHYSHLLVDEHAADGLLGELADLATEVGQPDTDLLVLGSAVHTRPNIRVIPAARMQVVIEALMASPPSRGDQAMDLPELRAAMKAAMIEARYQPIVRIADRQPVGLEALARLNHPELGTILPDRFVPQIEDAGLAPELTNLVATRAFADLAGPFLAGRNVKLSLNFPLDVLTSPDTLDRLDSQRMAAGITADRIIIELTESRPVEDIDTLRRSLELLRARGYCAAIDDVGPAVPKLSRMLDLPFSGLKLDKDLVRRASREPDVMAFVTATVESARKSDWTVVA